MFVRGFKTWCERIALQYRRDLNLKATDPLAPRRLADHLKVKVWTDSDVPGLDEEHLQTLRDDSSSWSAVTIWNGLRALIILNAAHSIGRQASDLMHELAHIIIGHKPSRMDVSEDGLLLLHSFDKGLEDEANWLASCLLLPREVLMFTRRREMTEKEIREHYEVSAEMLTFRLRMSGVDAQMQRAKALWNRKS